MLFARATSVAHNVLRIHKELESELDLEHHGERVMQISIRTKTKLKTDVYDSRLFLADKTVSQ